MRKTIPIIECTKINEDAKQQSEYNTGTKFYVIKDSQKMTLRSSSNADKKQCESIIAAYKNGQRSQIF